MDRKHITYHDNVEQGSPEWHAMRCGVLSASEVKLIISPKKLDPAKNDKAKMHAFEIAAQRISKYVEPSYISDDMLRGYEGEIEARNLYSEHFEKVTECGFVTNDKWGFTIGYSPDGLVGDNGLEETKTRRQKYQVKTISEMSVPDEFIMQHQTGLLVTEREWIDFLPISLGMPMVPIRMTPIPKIQEAIVRAATAFEESVQEIIAKYEFNLKNNKHVETKRLDPENEGGLI